MFQLSVMVPCHIYLKRLRGLVLGGWCPSFAWALFLRTCLPPGHPCGASIVIFFPEVMALPVLDSSVAPCRIKAIYTVPHVPHLSRYHPLASFLWVPLCPNWISQSFFCTLHSVPPLCLCWPCSASPGHRPQAHLPFRACFECWLLHKVFSDCTAWRNPAFLELPWNLINFFFFWWRPWREGHCLLCVTAHPSAAISQHTLDLSQYLHSFDGWFAKNHAGKC